MTDEILENSLRHAGAAAPFPVSPSLKARTLTRLRSGRAGRPRRLPVVAASVLVMLLLVPATLLAVGEPILGVQIKISDLSPLEWLKQVGFRDWVASTGPAELLSPEETARVATFPIRQPTWLPEGMQATGEPRGAHGNEYRDGRWHPDGPFFTTQSFQSGDHRLGVLHQERGEMKSLTLPPGTEQLTVAGHPAFLWVDVPLAKADAESEARSKQGELPEIVGYQNQLTLWVQEEDGGVTDITLMGSLDPETLIRIAESLFE